MYYDITERERERERERRADLTRNGVRDEPSNLYHKRIILFIDIMY